MDILQDISIIFISIFFESLPFLFLGALLSACIETYISNEQIAKIIPKNKILGSFFGVFLGLFIPACDCAVIPISKRLLKKKVPINVAISFLLSAPIINPVVLFATYSAFYKTNPEIFWYRLILGISIALIIGIIMGLIFRNKEVITNDISNNKCCHQHHPKKHSFKNDFLSITKHTSYDLFEVLKYLIIGALIASAIQVLLPRNILMIFNNNILISIIALMLFAYLISLCSTSDSFVGRSLLSSFNEVSIIAYLLLGPMIDIKNTFVLLGNYNKKFVVTLIILIFTIVFIASALVVKIL